MTSITDNFIVARSSFDRFLSIPKKISSNGRADNEVRLLLGQEIGKSIEFAANLLMEQRLSGDRERELGISTAWSYALRGEALKVGLETIYSNESQPGKRHLARNIFELGPAFTYKPSPHTRIDVAPLAGIGHDSPYLETFLIFGVTPLNGQV